jgi:outer membrane receptor for ferrienterochelin and colicins
MPHSIRWAALAVALATLGRGLFADDAPDLALGDVSITATRIAESPSEVPPAITVVSAADIEARGAKTATDAIKTVPGLGVSDYGPEGAEKAISIRGSTANEVLVLVDGVRVNDAMSGLADLANIPADDIDHIEVLREGGSALYGGDAVGGVINIITKKKAAPLVLGFENGAFLPAAHVEGYGFSKVDEPADAASLVDTQKASFSWAPAAGDLQFRGAGSFTKADNAYTFIDSNGDNRVLQNAALLGGDGSFGLTFPCLEGSVAADFAGAYSRKEDPGAQSNPTLAAGETDSSGRASIKYSTDRFLADALSLDFTLHAEYSGFDYVDADAPSDDGRSMVYVGGADLQQKASVSDSLSFVYGGSFAYTQARSDTVGSPSRIAGGAYFEPVIEAGAFSLRPAVRYDYYSDFFANDPLGGIGATIAVAYRLSESDALKLNLSRSYRVPTFEDLYWPAADGAAGNPDLQPETAYAADFGFERHRGSFSYSVIGYVRYIQDVIIWQPGSDGIWRPSNYGAALYPGIETELKTAFADHYTADINYSYLYSYNLSGGLTLGDDQRLPMTPVHSLNATLGYEAGRLAWSATLKYASLRFLTTANATNLPDYFTLDAVVKWKFDARYAAYLAVDNLFGEQYQLVQDYPMPGTELRMGIEIRV